LEKMHVKLGNSKAAPAKPKILGPNVGVAKLAQKLGKSFAPANPENTETVAQNVTSEPSQEAKDVRLVSCYRSSGAMPIPRQAAVIKNPPKWSPKIPPKIPTLNLQAHSESQEDVLEEVVEEFQSDEVEIDTADVEEVKNDLIKAVVVEVKVEAPPPAKAKQQSCKKHSRCHCDLLSLETTEFFTIQV